ncbi:putative vacuolar atp synthase subunit f [Toxoplasma gondii RUB]|uniref:Putative vacuolar atp synthase subunit f n=1 Tax=Toxoplasma gondii RUB TaxID=935652 RepID=A0A086MAE9_TOXGO|nr:putative vacuolar atp synthase subunit f [Toxoplasma gondii RUB]
MHQFRCLARTKKHYCGGDTVENHSDKNKELQLEQIFAPATVCGLSRLRPAAGCSKVVLVSKILLVLAKMAPVLGRVQGTDLKVAVIGDEDTVAGFLMAGIGMRDGLGRTNFFIVDSKTKRQDVEDAFRTMTERPDIGIVLINQHVADDIRYMVDLHTKIIPTILEIPSKDKPYDPSKDSVMQRIKFFFGGELPTS